MVFMVFVYTDIAASSHELENKKERREELPETLSPSTEGRKRQEHETSHMACSQNYVTVRPLCSLALHLITDDLSFSSIPVNFHLP
jgi:hypothetical protein